MQALSGTYLFTREPVGKAYLDTLTVSQLFNSDLLDRPEVYDL